MPVDIQSDQATAAPVVEQSSPDQATGSEAAVSSPTTSASLSTENPSSSADPVSQATTEQDLLSADEYAAVKDDPVAMRKAMNRAYTQKTQAIAEERKRLEAYQGLISGLEANPLQTLELLGQQLGVKIVQPGSEVQAPPQVSQRDQLVGQLKTKLDEYGLGAVAPELVAVAQGIAEEIAGQKLKPIEEAAGRLTTESQQREAANIMQQFQARHPDWKQHESAMMELSKRYKPATDAQGRFLVTEGQYLDDLYRLANYETNVRTEAQKQLDRMRQSAAATEPRTTTVTSDKVSQKAPTGASFRAAYEAAKRGETWE
jgi:hypothetical protein